MTPLRMTLPKNLQVDFEVLIAANVCRTTDMTKSAGFCPADFVICFC